MMDMIKNDQPTTSAINTNDEHAAKRRKGIRNSNTYQRNIIRNSRVKGQEYITYKNKVSQAKQIGLSCK